MVPIFKECARAKRSRSGRRAMVPSSFKISTIMAAGENPARRARSQPASVWPARVSTPPGCAIRGKMCPGWRRSSGRAFGATAVLTVCARSCAEIPVVTPFGGLDGQGEVGAVRAVGLAHHERQPQLAAALARQRQTDEAAAVARHEIDVLRTHALRRHDQIAFVFAILIVHEHRHLAVAKVLENLVDRIHRSP